MPKTLPEKHLFKAYLQILTPFLLILFTSGCIKIGIPEYFAGKLLTTSNRTAQAQNFYRGSTCKPLLLEFHADQSLSKSIGAAKTKMPDEFLGNQYLLMLLPFTRLYVQHRSYSLFQEVLIDELKNLGYGILVSDNYNEQTSAKVHQWQTPHTPQFPQLPPQTLHLEATLRDLSINAWDLFFSRLLTVDVNFKLTNLNSSSPARYSSISDYHFSKYGHITDLAKFVESTLSDKLRTQVIPSLLDDQDIDKNINNYYPIQKTEGKTPLIMISSQLTLDDPLKWSNSFAKSYGINDPGRFSLNSIARILQRGLHAGAANVMPQTLSFVPCTSAQNVTAPPLASWRLLSEVKLTSSSDDFLPSKYYMEVTFELVDSLTPGTRPSTLKTTSTKIELLPDSTIDGSLVVAIESAAQSAVEQFLR